MAAKPKLNLPPTHPEVHRRIMEAIRETPVDELIAMMEYREPGIPETDMNGDLLEMYRERREQREAEQRQSEQREAQIQTLAKSAA